MPIYKLPNISKMQANATSREKIYLRYLGYWCPHVDDPPPGHRMRLLRSYINSFDLRHDWGQINPEKVWDYVCVMIDREDKHPYAPPSTT